MERKELFYCCIFIFMSLFFGGCHRNKALLEQLGGERDSLIMVNEHQRVVLDDMTSMVVEITSILDTISAQERILMSKYDQEGRLYTRKQVIENLKLFEQTLIDKRNEIQRLDSIVSGNESQVQKLTSLIRYLNMEIEKKDSTIKVLRAEVEQKNYNIRQLNRKIDTMNSNIEQLSDSLSLVAQSKQEIENQMKQQEGDMYTVYYIVATRKELIANGIIEKNGMFKSKVNMSAAIDLAERIDYRDIDVIEIYGHTPKIMTDVPSDSYLLNKLSDVKFELVITDKMRFWAANKMLIVQVK